MNKTELTRQIAEKTGISQKSIKQVVDLTFGIISKSIDSNENVTISDFGTWSLKKMKERNGINPATKESIVIPAREKVAFKPHNKIRYYHQIYQ